MVDPEHQNLNDPFLAYCKQHNEKELISERKTNYAAMIATHKNKWSIVKTNPNKILFDDDPDSERLTIKYKEARENYALKKEKIQHSLLDEQSIISRNHPRMLTHCPFVVKQLLLKTRQCNSDNGDLFINEENESRLIK